MWHLNLFFLLFLFVGCNEDCDEQCSALSAKIKKIEAQINSTIIKDKALLYNEIVTIHYKSKKNQLESFKIFQNNMDLKKDQKSLLEIQVWLMAFIEKIPETEIKLKSIDLYAPLLQSNLKINKQVTLMRLKGIGLRNVQSPELLTKIIEVLEFGIRNNADDIAIQSLTTISELALTSQAQTVKQKCIEILQRAAKETSTIVRKKAQEQLKRFEPT